MFDRSFACRIALPVLLAATLTGLNALKPPCIDDTAYLAVARQIAAHPLDPYGFEQFWYEAPQPANEVLAPPVLPYWLGLGIRVLGEDPVLLKLWLFPVALLLTFSLNGLLRRYARGVEAPFLVALILSPAILPGFNFMLDVPTLALATTAVLLFLRAVERPSWTTALAAGFLAGLAAQTKYTGAIVSPLLLGLALLHRRPRFGVMAAAVAAGLFIAWEAFTRGLYGESHFLIALHDSQPSLMEKLLLAPAALHLLGGVGPLVVLLTLAAMRRSWLPLVGGALLAATYAALALVPDTLFSIWLPGDQRSGPGLARWLLQAWGWTALASLALVVLRLLLRRGRSLQIRLRRPTLELLLWLLLEGCGYFAMTHFPAARRVLGATVVATLLVAALASKTCRRPGARRGLWLAAAPSAALGLFLASVDIADSRLEPDAVREAVTLIRRDDPEGRIWFTGHWGFQYEAERLGLRPMAPGRSALRPGDWLIDAPEWIAKQGFLPDARAGEPFYLVTLDRGLRLRTLPSYYGGELPVGWWPRPMIEVRAYRVRQTWVPQPD